MTPRAAVDMLTRYAWQGRQTKEAMRERLAQAMQILICEGVHDSDCRCPECDREYNASPFQSDLDHVDMADRERVCRAS